MSEGGPGVDLYEKTAPIHNRRIEGYFQTLRDKTAWLTLGLYFGLPWVLWQGQQAVFLDIPHRRFNFFAWTFWPQDFFLLSWWILIALLTLFLVTAVAGRVWCGFTCPQTVWTRWFMAWEYFCEGDRAQRLRWDKAKFSWEKYLRRGSKHLGWLAIAWITAVCFVGYFSPIRDLCFRILHADLSGQERFWLAFFTLATYGNAGWMREQVCKHVCPYARLQSVMVDTDTLVIAYDKQRGEPRGKRNLKDEATLKTMGDCVDCGWCVQVCPTGIDIRKGLQMECIGCAACIDACDQVMDKLNFPRGLIRYASEQENRGFKTHFWRPRVLVHASVLLVLIALFVTALIVRSPVLVEVLKDRNVLYRSLGGRIENVYTVKLMNRDQHAINVRLEVKAPFRLRCEGCQQFFITPEQFAGLSSATVGGRRRCVGCYVVVGMAGDRRNFFQNPGSR